VHFGSARSLSLKRCSDPACGAEIEDLRDLLLKKFAKWQLPDDFVFVSDLPHTFTGKLLKTELRKSYAHWHQRDEAKY
jgi:acyl-CoA synthetase (AMP-forming)/AMP-acid ligase II